MKHDKKINEEKQLEHFNKRDILDKLIPLVENTAMRFNVIPVEIDFSKENHKWFLRIFIYSKERNITLDDCENMSRSLGEFIDEIIPVKFNLEISSPGLERKLKSEKEYLIFIGKDILIKLKNGIDETYEKQFVCKIVDFDTNKGLTVFLYGSKKEVLISKENIIYARLYSQDI
ncbi:ribosome maturation factor RimP [bacterium]|nr:ribosome maturation factor RimP [bacterium]